MGAMAFPIKGVASGRAGRYLAYQGIGCFIIRVAGKTPYGSFQSGILSGEIGGGLLADLRHN